MPERSTSRWPALLTRLLSGSAEGRASDRERTEVLHGLPQGQTLLIDGSRGQEVACQRGSLRIAYDDELEAQVLVAGQTHCCERDAARIRVLALDDALVWSSSVAGVMAGVTTAVVCSRR